jgi:two-component system sensor histidine kinase KdpD
MQTSQENSTPQAASQWRDYVFALAACGFTALAATPLRARLDLANTVMLFLLTVALVAVRLGRKPALLAAFMSVALFDFFFVPPRFSFAVNDAQYLVTFGVMLAVALIVSHLTAGLHQQATEAKAREQRSHALYGLAKALAGAVSREQVREATRVFLRDTLHGETRLLLPDAAEELRAIGEDMSALSLPVLYTARSVLDSAQPIASAQMADEDLRSLYLPLQGATRMRGVLVLTLPLGLAQALQEQRPLLQAVASLVATAVERLHFVEVAQDSQLQIASERLRSSILSALSHDVRTPLTALYGLADTLVLSQLPLPAELLDTANAIRDQALRLNGMVGNLLDMARLQAGKVTLRKEWQPLEEVIGASIKLLGAGLQAHPVRVTLPRDLPLLEFDAVLLERVFCNLLENAAKYAPAGAEIVIQASRIEAAVEVTICNPGAGFPADRLEKIFEIFERGAPESALPGVGIGLAICRAIVEAHGGRIQAFNPSTGGACVRFSLPCGQPPLIEAETLP